MPAFIRLGARLELTTWHVESMSLFGDLQAIQPQHGQDSMMLRRSALKAWTVYWFKLANLWFPWVAVMSLQNDVERK